MKRFLIVLGLVLSVHLFAQKSVSVDKLSKELNTAVANGEYTEAAKLKSTIDFVNTDPEMAGLFDALSTAIATEDYVKAQELKETIDAKINTYKTSQTSTNTSQTTTAPTQNSVIIIDDYSTSSSGTYSNDGYGSKSVGDGYAFNSGVYFKVGLGAAALNYSFADAQNIIAGVQLELGSIFYFSNKEYDESSATNTKSKVGLNVSFLNHHVMLGEDAYGFFTPGVYFRLFNVGPQLTYKLDQNNFLDVSCVVGPTVAMTPITFSEYDLYEYAGGYYYNYYGYYYEETDLFVGTGVAISAGVQYRTKHFTAGLNLLITQSKGSLLYYDQISTTMRGFGLDVSVGYDF